MGQDVFTSLGVRDGCWSGLLRAEAPPGRLLLIHLGQPVAEARVQPAGAGEWQIDVDLPATVLTDGCHNLLLVADEGARIASLPVTAGAPLDDDLRAEIELLRAELELVKAELRRIARG